MRGAKSLKRKLRRMNRNLQSNVNDSVQRSLGDTKRTAQNRIETQDAFGSGELWSSFRQYGPRSVGDHDVHRLANVAAHAPLVEFGTGSFFRPNRYTERFEAPTMGPSLVSAIKRWIILKPTFAVPPNPAETATYIAEAIATGTDDRPPGTPAQPFFFDAWEVNEPILVERAEYAVGRTVRRP